MTYLTRGCRLPPAHGGAILVLSVASITLKWCTAQRHFLAVCLELYKSVLKPIIFPCILKLLWAPLVTK